VRRLYAWLAGLVGGAAAYRALRRRPEPPAAPEPDPADALKAKLAEARAVEPDEPADVESRRASVHEQARAAIDEMDAGE
jgi:hypothetical protein